MAAHNIILSHATAVHIYRNKYQVIYLLTRPHNFVVCFTMLVLQIKSRKEVGLNIHSKHYKVALFSMAHPDRARWRSWHHRTL